MRVVITGGAGFLGLRLARRILEAGELRTAEGPREVHELVLFDRDEPASTLPDDSRLRVVTGDIADSTSVRKLIGPGTDSVFHLASVVSAGAEADFDLGYRVNLDGTRNVLEAVRGTGGAPRLVFASSVAVYGGEIPEVVTDDTPVTPQSSYGTHKAVGEMLLNDYSRKGYLDGRTLRLPTVVVRPGKPNKAASGFASGIVREPLAGIDFTCPVSRSFRMAIMSPRTVIECLLLGHELDGARLGGWRTVLLNALTVSMEETVEALHRAAMGRVLGRIDFIVDPHIERIVSAWPMGMRSSRAGTLGFPVDRSIEDVIRAYIEDEADPLA